MKMQNYDQLKRLAREYLKARHIFLKAALKLPDLHGNDNIVGRIGELVAIQFLRDQKRKVEKNASAVQKGFDLMTSDKKMISVKTITAENKSGRTTKIKDPWDELVLITLNEKYKVDKIGHIKNSQLQKIFNQGGITSLEPYATRKLLEDGVLFSEKNIYQGKKVLKYL